MKEALLYEKQEDKVALCHLCSHRCKIADQKFGLCGARQNISGVLYTHAYGKLIANHVDPVEKKPLYHFLPGHPSYSIATIGCNFRCGFCQNWEISQSSFRDGDFPGIEFSSENIVKAAIESQSKSISYTYTEPTIFFEYAIETAKLAKENGLKNIFVTNGYMTKEALLEIKPYLDAANVDLKFFRESSYKRVCSASLEPVLETIRTMNQLGIWVEVTTLVIPGENDSDEELENIAKFLSKVNSGIPWHISRFHSDYKFADYEPTPEKTLKRAEAIGRKAGLKYIYVGNVWGWGNDTVCPGCKKILVRREGFNVLENNIRNNKCIFCETFIPGVFK